MNSPTRHRSGLTLLELLIVVVLIAILAMLVVPMIGTTVVTSELDVTYQTMQAARDAIMGAPGAPSFRNDLKGVASGRAATFQLADAEGLPAPIVGQRGFLRELLQNGSATTYPAFDPQVQRGWRGPYLRQTTNGYGPVFGFAADVPLVLDSFPFRNSSTGATAPGSPIFIEWPAADVAGVPRQNLVRLHSLGADGVETPNLANKWIPSAMTGADCGDDLILYIRRDLAGLDWSNYWQLKKSLQGTH